MAKARKYGWFGGVFTPSILTILGVIMYLRLPSIVGQAGLMAAVGIVLIAHVISISTGLSVASIATDKKVQAGGTYYMISRSLGLPIGGTLGLALFVGLSFSVSLYVIGFSESFLGYWGFEVTKDAIRVAGSLTLLVVTGVTFLSTELALKTQFYILAAIGLSLVSILLGSHDLAPVASTAVASAPAASATPFIVLFGIFFPAVTGFEAGVSMSGDLKDPKKAIPVGTILAIFVGLTVYLALSTFLAKTVSAEALRDDPNVLLNIARVPALVVAGIWGATISSALGSILGAPRILQATAVDRIAPRLFAKGFGPSNEPRNALLVTFVIAEVGILIGELNVIARVVSMFFITTYGFLNLSCVIERWASPDFRPDFKVPAWVGLIGSAACFIVMIQLDFVAMVGATVVLGALYIILARRQLTLASGDTWEGVWASLSRLALSRLIVRQVHQRNWRPNILLFAGAVEGRSHLRRLGEWLAYKRGLVSNVELVETPNVPKRPTLVSSPEGRVGFFTHRVECHDRWDAMVETSRLHGFAGVEPNTVLLGWPKTSRAPSRFHETLDSLAGLDLNLLVLDFDTQKAYGAFRSIDVWLEGGGRNASLALALVQFLTTADPWRRASVRFLKWHEGESAFAGALRDSLEEIIRDRRLGASVQVVQATGGEDFADAVQRESGSTDLTLVGVPKAGSLSTEGFVRQTNQILDVIGTVILLRASSSFEDLSLGEFTDEARVLPEEELEAAVGPDPSLLIEQDGVLRSEVVTLGTRVGEIIEDVRSEISVTEGLGAPLLSAMSDLASDTLASIGHAFATSDRPRRVRALDREMARLLFHGREIFSDARGQALETQAGTLGRAVGLATRRLEGLSPTLPTRIGKWGSSLRLRSSFEAQALPLLLGLLTDAVGRFDRRAAARVEAAVRMHAALVDGLIRVSEALEGDDLEPESVLEHERDRIAALEQELIENLDHARSSDGAVLRTGPNHVLSQWVTSLAGPGELRWKKQTTTPRERRDTILRLRDVGPAWHSHQSLRFREAELEARLRGARHRMEVVLERALQDVRIETDTTVRGLEALRAQVSEHAESPNAGHGSVMQEVVSSLNGRSVVATIASELRNAVQDLPEEWPAPAQGAEDTDALDVVETRRITPRDIVDYRVQATLVTPLEPRLLALSSACARGSETAREVARLVRFASTDEVQLEVRASAGPPQSVVTRVQERLTEAQQKIESASEAVAESAARGLRAVESHLIASAVAAAPGEGDRRGSTAGARWWSTALASLGDVRQTLAQRLGRVWYRRSRGVILTERIRAGERDRTPVDRLLGVVESVSPDPEVLRALPFYYRQLFLERAVATRDFWIARPRAEAQVQRAIERYERGYEGALLVVGDPGSGKSSLVSHVAQRYPERSVLRLTPPPLATADLGRFEEQLRQTLGARDDLKRAFDDLPAGTLLLVEDLDLWWERRSGGLTVVEYLLGLLDHFAERCLFVVTMSPVTHELLRQVTRFDERFLASVRLGPFAADELRDSVLLRHRSSGMDLILEGRASQGVADWRLARFFNRLFDRSRGNVGEALKSWIASIDSVEGDRVYVRSRELPRLGALDELHPRQRALAGALLIHRRVSTEGLQRMTGLEGAGLEKEILALRRCGILESRDGVLSVNRFLEADLRRDLQGRGIL